MSARIRSPHAGCGAPPVRSRFCTDCRFEVDVFRNGPGWENANASSAIVDHSDFFDRHQAIFD